MRAIDKLLQSSGHQYFLARLRPLCGSPRLLCGSPCPKFKLTFMIDLVDDIDLIEKCADVND